MRHVGRDVPAADCVFNARWREGRLDHEAWEVSFFEFFDICSTDTFHDITGCDC